MTEENKALANYKEMIKAELEGNKTAISTGGSSKITAKNKVFSLPDGTSSTDPIQVVVLEFTNSYADFELPYSAGNHAPPRCWAKGKNLLAMSPADDVTEPQSTACEGCPNNEFESAANGKGKHCTQSVSLAVVPPGAKPGIEPMLFNVPATSMKAWGNHVAMLGAKEMIPAMAVTSIAFDPGVDYNKFTFKHDGNVEDISAVMQMKPEALAVLG